MLLLEKCNILPEILPHGLPLEMDVDGGGGQGLHAAGVRGVGDGDGLGVPRVHAEQPQHRHEVCRGVLLDGAGDELQQHPHQLVPARLQLLLLNVVSQLRDYMGERNKLKW